jgi:hypothetical protein
LSFEKRSRLVVSKHFAWFLPVDPIPTSSEYIALGHCCCCLFVFDEKKWEIKKGMHFFKEE